MGAYVLIEAARAIVAIVLFAWLPGHAWRRVALPDLRGLAGFVIDAVLSIAIVSLLVVLANTLLGVPVSAATTVWLALAATFAAIVPFLARRVEAWVSVR